MVLTHTIYNELSTSRNPNNMSLIGIVFQTQPEAAARVNAYHNYPKIFPVCMF